MPDSTRSDNGKFNLLSRIGLDILSHLSVEAINDKVFDNINRLMDADVFGIGLYSEKKKEIYFPDIIEKGQKMSFFVSIEDKSRPAVWCFRNREAFIINKVTDFSNYNLPVLPLPAVGEVMRSFVYLPLVFNDKALGVFTVQSFKENAYGENELEILRTLSVFISTAIHNATVHESTEALVKERSAELQRQKDELEKAYERTRILSEIGRKISGSLSVEEIIDDTYASVKQLMDAQIFGIAVINSESQDVLDLSIIEYEKKLNAKIDLNDPYRPGSICFNQERDLILNDFQNEVLQINPEYQKPLVGRPVGSLVYLPLVQKGKKIGVITVQNYQKNVFTPINIEMLKMLSVHVSAALENALLYSGVEAEVKRRTEEIIKQKEEKELAFEHLKIVDEVGQQITATLDFEKIFEKLHSSVLKLMKADVFGVRLYHEDTNEVEIKYEVWKGKRHDGKSFSMENKNNFSVWCIENRKEIFMNDMLTEFRNYIDELYSLSTSGEHSHSLMFCPMLLGDKVLGVVTVQSYSRNQYTQQHLNIVKTLANYAAIALENANKYETQYRLNQKLEESFKNIQVLSDIGQEITSTLNFEEVLDKVYVHVNELMDATEFGVGICLPEENKLDLCYYIFRGKRMLTNNNDEHRYVKLDEKGRLSAVCVTRKEEIFINDFENEYKKYIPDLEAYKSEDDAFVLNSVMCLPLIVDNRVIGIITVQSEKKNAYSALQREMFRTLASYTAVALNNAESYHRLNESSARLQESYKNIQLIGEIGKKITSSLNLEKVIETIFEQISGLMDANEFGVGIYDEEKQELDLASIYFEGKKVNTTDSSFKLSMNDDGRLAVWCVKNRSEVFINDIETEYARFIPNLDAYNSGSGFLLNSLMCLPLIIEDRIIGNIFVQSGKKNAYTQMNLEMFRALAPYTAVAIDNAIVYRKLDSALHEVEKLSVVASRTNNTVIITNTETEIVWANQAFERNFGYHFDEFKVKKGRTLLEISGRKDIAELVKECVDQRRSVNYESENISGSGERLWFQTTLTPVMDDHGNVRNIVAIDSDITEIKKAEEMLWQKNKNITDSITYAKRIQHSILPSHERVKQLLPDSFVYYKPRDIVSGDFYWITSIDNGNKIIVAAVDCTGHGVPGAFLTIVGHSILNHIIIERRITHPAEIIRRMNAELISRLEVMHEDKVRDGMDMSICLIDRSRGTAEVTFSGAVNQSFYTDKGEVKEVVPIRHSVGYIPQAEEENIIYRTAMISEGDMVYLFTDGYADQLGGEAGRKFLKGRFRQLLKQVQHLSPAEQQNELDKALVRWKRNFGQTDDILVIGIRL